MNFRTVIEIPRAENTISYDTPVMLIGSCFAEDIGARFLSGKMDAMVNPSGILYNPFSLAYALETFIEGRLQGDDEYGFFDGKYLSYNHDTTFSSRSSDEVRANVEKSTREGSAFLKRCRFLFVTFGTAWVYRLSGNKRIVSNCHKIPEKNFIRELSGVDRMTDTWRNLLAKLFEYNPGIRVVITISPVRHWKDGAHGNQLSKSLLLLLSEELQRSYSERVSYFPSYEIVLDELRDYRFYKDDMLHPSAGAVEYIWERLGDTFFGSQTRDLCKEVSAIVRATRHRIMSEDPADSSKFAGSMIEKIARITQSHPSINFREELDYFKELL